ncbi:MAG: hypothetical protein HFI37_01865, partial [Lachnospiraceae bacterium]|nr:hypothetical protein [Lachnospiraceae bacterium]
MSIFFSVLKFIGIVLGILLAVLLTILLLTVFLPVCYHIQGQFESGQNEVRGRCSWLFSLIQIKFEAKEKKTFAYLSILGWKKHLYPGPEKTSEKKRRRKKEKKKRGEVSEETTEHTLEGRTGTDEDVSIQVTEWKPHETQKKSRTQKSLKKEKSLQKYFPWNMIKSWIQKIKQFISSVKKNFANIKRELSDETNRNGLIHLFRELKILLHHIGPRRGKVRFLYSAGEPALTGKLTGFMSICPVFYKKGVKVVPDFESDTCYIQGNFKIHGHIQMLHMLGIVY